MNMLSLKSYFGVVAVLVIGVGVVIMANEFSVPPATTQTIPSNASSTVSVVPSISASDMPVPQPELIATSTVEAPSKPIVLPKILKTASTSPSTSSTVQIAPPATVTPPSTTSSGSVSLDATASLLRGALVNIMCYAPAGGSVHSISGSGVVIDSKGIILTNAHIGQYFLLADRNVSCTIRTGSPATDAYKASLIYISPLWIKANATVLTQATPIGTGEYDFALLAITKSATENALPTLFSSIPLALQPPASGTPVVIASYGAQFLDASQIQSGLYPTIVFGSIKDIFTFAVNTIDVLALGGSAAAQEGSSGGGVADASGNLVGTITTSTIEGATATRSLAAISASYIRGEFASEMGSPLDFLLGEPTSFSIADFASQIPSLEAILTAQLH